jgi:hypothetical protein
MSRLAKWGFSVLTMVSVATIVLFVTGWGSAAASSMISVFVTNTASHPVPVNETNTDANGNIKVHEQGTANVQGTVTGRPAAPSAPFSAFIQPDAGTSAVLAGPSSVPINLTSLTGSSNETGWTLEFRSKQVPDSATDCSSNTLETTVFRAVNGSGIVTVPFPTPLQVVPTTGNKVCLVGFITDTPADAEVAINASGFYGN